MLCKIYSRQYELVHGRGVMEGLVRTLAVGRSTRTAVTSLPGFTSRVPDLAGSIDAGLWLSAKEER